MLNRDWLPINDPPLTLALLSPSTSFYTGRSVPAGRGFGRARRQSNSGGNLPQVQPRAGQVLHPAGERPPPRAATRSGPRAASGAWADGGGGRCGGAYRREHRGPGATSRGEPGRRSGPRRAAGRLGRAGPACGPHAVLAADRASRASRCKCAAAGGCAGAVGPLAVPPARALRAGARSATSGPQVAIGGSPAELA